MNTLIETLPLTNYLNQKVVFDLLAVIEDGFSQVTNLSNTNQINNNTNVNGGLEIGISNAFGLFGVKSKINAGKVKEISEANSKTEEKIHTPTSLFSKLSSYLDNRNLINDINSFSDFNNLTSGDFVRFK